MTYSTSVPQPTNPINTTYLAISSNFQILNTTLNTDHVPPTDATTANRGKHKQITMQVSSGNPGATAPFSAIFTKTVNNYSSGDKQQVFFQNQQDGVEQVTYPRDLSESGWTILPGGLLMQWGTATNATAPKTFAISYSKSFSTWVNLQATTIKQAGFDQGINVGQVTLNGANVYLTGSASSQVGIYWLAIGV